VSPKKARDSARGDLVAKGGAVSLPRRKKRVAGMSRVRKGQWGAAGAPFGREFFEHTLGGMVEACPCGDGRAPIVHVFLGDGTVLDVAGVVSLSDRFAVVAAFEGKGEDGIERTEDDLGFEAFPYDLVIRASVRAGPTRPQGFGFGQHHRREVKPPSPPSQS
jgi:hypothetical protein